MTAGAGGFAWPGAGTWPSRRRNGADVRASAPPSPRTAPAAASLEAPVPRSPIAGLQWSPLYAAFLLYVFVITTYQLGIGNLAMVAAIGGLLFQRQLRLPAFLLYLGLFLVWAGLGYVSTRYPEVVWQQLVNWGKLWLIAVVAANALRNRAHIRLFMIVFLGSFALYPLRGALFNYYVYHSAVFGRAVWNYIYNNPNDLAALALLQLSMVAALLVSEPKGWVRHAAFAGIGVVPLLILMTQSRGAFIALSVFVLFALFASRARLGRLRQNRGLIRIVAVVVVGIVVVLVAPTGVWNRVHGLKDVSHTEHLEAVDSEGSAHQRFEIWKVAVRIIADNPVTGVGLGGYRRTHEAYVQRGGFDPSARGQRDTHSTLLCVAAETGFPGLLLFLALVISPLWHAEKVRRRSKGVLPRTAAQLFYLEAGMVTYFIAGIFGSFAHLSFLYLHLALLWAIAEAGKKDLLRFGGSRRRSSWGR